MKKMLFGYALLPTIFLAALMGGAICAQAQSIDYKSLETLFGEPVTTSATGKPQRVTEAPVAMEIITADDIRRSGAKDMAEIMRFATGVSVMQSTRQQYDVNIRGYNQPFSPNLLVLVNGRQVYLDDYGYTVWATIPVQLEEIRQIEIVKGPNTALFGFNAASGVINIVTDNPLYDKKSSAGVTLGTDQYRSAHFVKSFNGDKAGLRISAGASKADEFDSSVNGLDPANLFISPERRAVNVDGMIQVTPKSQLRVEASNSKVQQPEMTPFHFLTSSHHLTNSLKTAYEADTSYGLMKAIVYKNWLSLNVSGDLYAPFQSSNVKNDVLVMQLEDTFKIGINHAFRIQGEYRHGEASGALVGPAGASIQNDIYALSGMWGWTINDSWELTNSVRIDRLQMARQGPFDVFAPYTDHDFDQNTTEPSYNSGLIWKATADDTFRLNTARGLRVTSFMDAGIALRPGPVFGPFPVLIVGNPRLSPTVMTNYEFGWDHAIRPLNSALKVSIFTQKTLDVFSNGIHVLPPIVLQSDNVGSSRTVGAEFGLKGKIGEHWSWGVNDTVQKINDSYSVASKNSEDTSPVNLANVHLGYQNGSWEADAFAYYVSSFEGREANANILVPSTFVKIPAYVSLSGRVGYKINDKTTVAVSGQELQSDHATRTDGPDVERRVFISLDRDF